jgi:hypothetical protein
LPSPAVAARERGALGATPREMARSRAIDVEVVKLLSPEYTAVIECGEPAVEAYVVVQVASSCPEMVDKDCAEQPDISLPPSLNSTCPVGDPAPGAIALTVAVRVTGWFSNAGLADEASTVSVEAGFTVWFTALELDPVKLESF